MVIFENVKIAKNWQKLTKKRDFCQKSTILAKKVKKMDKTEKKSEKMQNQPIL